MSTWIRACGADDIGEEDVIRLDHDGTMLAVYRLKGGRFFATDGLCTHEKVYLADGFIVGDAIECPKHGGRFDIPTGQAHGAPVCVNLRTYPVKVEAGRIFVDLG